MKRATTTVKLTAQEIGRLVTALSIAIKGHGYVEYYDLLRRFEQLEKRK